MNPMMMKQPQDEQEDTAIMPTGQDFSEHSPDDIQAILEELGQAQDAGDNFEAKSSFEDVPGTDPGSQENPMGDAGGMDEMKLKMLLAQLGQK